MGLPTIQISTDPSPLRAHDPATIIAEVAFRYRVQVSEIMGRGRPQHIARARQAAMAGQ